MKFCVKVLAAILSLGMICTVSGCGSDKNSGSDSTSDSVSVTSVVSQTIELSESVSEDTESSQPKEESKATESSASEEESQKEDEAQKEEEALRAKLEEYINLIDVKIGEKKFDEALALIDDAEVKLGDSVLLASKKIEISKARIKGKADDLEAAKDDKELIKYLEETRDQWEEWNDSMLYVDKLSSAVVSYRSSVMKDAETFFQSGNIDKAVETLNEGLTVLQDDQTLTDKISEYKEYLPVSLSEVILADGEDDELFYTYKDPRGKEYENALCLGCFFISGHGYREDHYDFYIDKKYSEFNFTIDPDSSFVDSPYAGDGSVVRIYAYNGGDTDLDDNLKYESPLIKMTTDGLSTKVDGLSEYSYLRIEVHAMVEAGARTGSSVLIHDAYFTK